MKLLAVGFFCKQISHDAFYYNYLGGIIRIEIVPRL